MKSVGQLSVSRRRMGRGVDRAVRKEMCVDTQ